VEGEAAAEVAEVAAEAAAEVVWFVGCRRSAKDCRDRPFLFSYIELKRQ
jgi:hypothetical protein